MRVLNSYKKTLTTTAILAAITAAAMTVPAFAGTWKTDNGKWWYDNGDGTWPQNQWQWIDGNEDGLAESYYFDPNGYLVVSATTPDGYTVLENYQNGALASVTYEKNNVKLSQAEYQNSLNADIGNQASYKNASVKNALEITAGNIQKMQENAAFAIR